MLRDVVLEHLEEAEILVERRGMALRSVKYDLSALGALEGRLNAHLEGVAVPRRGRSPELGEPPPDPAACFVWAVAELQETGRHRPHRILGAACLAGSSVIRAVVEALGYDDLAAPMCSDLLAWCIEGTAVQLGVALDVLSFHRVDVGDGLRLGCRSPRSATRAAAARAAGRLRRRDHEAAVEALFDDPDPEVRDAALGAGARLGIGRTPDRLRALLTRDSTATSEAIRLLGCIGGRSDVAVIAARISTPSLAEAALTALGTLGAVDAVPILLACMRKKTLRRAAGRVFHRITGIEPGATDEEPDEETCDFHDLRPVPDPDAAEREWTERAGAYRLDLRYREGRPLVTGAWLLDPHGGDLATRREELTRLWSVEPGHFADLELDAPARRQLRTTRAEAAP